MNKLFFCLLVFSVCLAGCSRSLRTSTSDCFIEMGSGAEPYCTQIPIEKFSAIQAPCIGIVIENKRFLAALDLGFKGGISLTKSTISQIESKEFIDTTHKYGIRGKKYEKRVFRIPEAKCGKIVYTNVAILEENEDLHADAVFVKDGSKPSPPEKATVGWQLFTNTCLLIDVKNRVLACCDSLDTLQERGYDTSRFSSCPLSIERGLVEFMAESPEGPIRCTLDSGATINLRHCDAPPEVSIQDMIFDEKNRGTLSLKIGGRNFGLVGYQSVPIRLPIPMELTLGMEFIETHLIFIDFVRKVIHFAQIDDLP